MDALEKIREMPINKPIERRARRVRVHTPHRDARFEKLEVREHLQLAIDDVCAGKPRAVVRARRV